MKKTYIAPLVTKMLSVDEQIIAASITSVGGDVNTELTFTKDDPEPDVEADVKGTIFDDEDLWDIDY